MPNPEGLIDPIPHSIIEIPSFASCTAYNFPPAASYSLLFLSLNFQFHPSSLFSYLPLFPFFPYFPSVFLFPSVSHPSGNVFPFPFSHYSPRNNSNRNLISQLFRSCNLWKRNRAKIKCEEYRRKLEKRMYLSIKRRRRRWRRSEEQSFLSFEYFGLSFLFSSLPFS